MKKLYFILLILAVSVGMAGAQNYKTIGSGSSTEISSWLPSYSDLKYSYSQIIYENNEMPHEGDLRITSIGFYYSGKGGTGTIINGVSYSRSLNIYMKNVTKSSFDNNLDCMAVSSADLVYSGKVTATSEGWITITLDHPFAYYNKPGNHLLIAIYDNTGSNSSSYFRYSTDSNKHYLVYASENKPNIDPSNPVKFKNRIEVKKSLSHRPIIRLGYTSISGATIPYNCDFNYNEMGNWSLKNNWEDSVKYASWHSNGNSLICGVNNTYIYNGYQEVVMAERRISLGEHDSIIISFNCLVNGEGSKYNVYDYVCAFLVPLDTNWLPLKSHSCPWLGSPNSSSVYKLPYILHFGEGLTNTKLANRDNETMSATIANPAKNKTWKLVFVWRMDGGSGTGPIIKSLRIAGKNKKNPDQEYTPKSTAQWYGYAAATAPADLNEKFVTFTMQDLGNVTAATDSIVEKNFASTYADGKVWYFTTTPPRSIGNALIDKNNKKIYRFRKTELSSGTIDQNIKSMSYNPVDNKLYFIDNSPKLYSMDMDDLDHFTIIGQMTDTLQTFAIDRQGNAYGITLNSGKLLKVNLDNGKTTFVGNTGVNDVYYVQSMAFDYKTGELFWAHCGYYKPYRMYCVDVTTGKAKYIGCLGGEYGIELTGLFTADNTSAIRNIAVQQLEVYPNPANDILFIQNVPEGLVRVYDVAGREVMRHEVPGNEDHFQLNISTLSKGLYFVKIGNHTAKFAKE